MKVVTDPRPAELLADPHRPAREIAGEAPPRVARDQPHVDGTGRSPDRVAVPAPPQSPDTLLAVRIRELATDPKNAGALEEARQLFGDLVARHQRRALRIAYQYLRDAAEADEAVQDAFVKAFSHIASYREAWPFEVWFTRVLVNGCLDRRKARSRRERWLAPLGAFSAASPGQPMVEPAASGENPEALLLARERRAHLASAIDRLAGRQRTVFMLCHFGDRTPKEVSAITGLNESTVRVHLFRAARKLRHALGARHA
jgi:RNA polymerase sigma-70 factor (ECF subfamily)